MSTALAPYRGRHVATATVLVTYVLASGEAVQLKTPKMDSGSDGGPVFGFFAAGCTLAAGLFVLWLRWRWGA